MNIDQANKISDAATKNGFHDLSKRIKNLISSDDVLNRAIAQYGEYAQWEKIEEECLELALAVHRYRKNKTEINFKALLDEVADVKIVIKVAEMLISTPLIEGRVNFKIKRLKERLANTDVCVTEE